MQKLRFNQSKLNFYNFNFQPEIKSSAFFKKQLKDYYELPNSFFKGTLSSLVLRLEKRLDVLLVRSQLVSSLKESRQLINHKKVKINGLIHPFSGYHLEPGDTVQLVNSIPSFNKKLWKPLIGIPSYLEVNYSIQSFIYLQTPNLKEIPIPFSLDNTYPIS